MELLDLHHDTTRVLCGLLTCEDLDALTRVSSAARRVFLQAFEDAKPLVVVLPPLDEDHTRTLLLGLDPAILPRVTWTTVENARHIDLIVECGLASLVTSVRVEARNNRDNETLANSLCWKLPLLTGVTKLSLLDTVCVDVTPLSQMLQLRELSLNQTRIKDISSLSSLTKLESLVIQQARVNDLSCVQFMPELKVLKVDTTKEVSMPPLSSLTKLRTLDLHYCTLDSASDLLAVTVTLDHLRLSNVKTRSPTLDNAISLEGRSTAELTYNLAQLKCVSSPGKLFKFGGRPTVFTRVAGIFSVTSCFIKEGGDLNAIAALARLKELCSELPTPWREPNDFKVLLRHPRLTSLEITTTKRTTMKDQQNQEEDIAHNGEALGEVLNQLHHLARLVFHGYVDPPATLSKLTHLKHLELDCDWQHEVVAFGWLDSFHCLRSLKLQGLSSESDLSPIGSLVGLEELHLSVSRASGGGTPRLCFISQLINVKILWLELSLYLDLAELRGMKSLEDLTITTSLMGEVMIQGVDILAEFTRLRKLNIASTSITEVSVLTRLPRLRAVWISRTADCSALVHQDPFGLLRVFHPNLDCRWGCKYRAPA